MIPEPNNLCKAACAAASVTKYPPWPQTAGHPHARSACGHHNTEEGGRGKPAGIRGGPEMSRGHKSPPTGPTAHMRKWWGWRGSSSSLPRQSPAMRRNCCWGQEFNTGRSSSSRREERLRWVLWKQKKGTSGGGPCWMGKPPANAGDRRFPRLRPACPRAHTLLMTGRTHSSREAHALCLRSATREAPQWEASAAKRSPRNEKPPQWEALHNEKPHNESLRNEKPVHCRRGDPGKA